MKRELPLRSNALALALALSFALGAPGYSHADTKSLMNPMNWFSGNSSEKSAQQAAKKAQAAQAAADRAMAEAQKAMEKAAEAQRQAAALNIESTTSNEKPVVTAPASQATTQPSAQTTEEAASSSTNEQANQRVYQDAATNSATTESPKTQQEEAFSQPTTKSEPWNPLSWFRKGPDESANTTESSESAEETSTTLNTNQTSATREPATTAPEARQAAAPSATASSINEAQSEPAAATQTTEQSTGQPANGKNTNFWNPMRLLSKPQTTASSEPVTESEPQQVLSKPEAIFKTKAAVMETERGNIAFELYPEQAPQTVSNFAKLVNEGFYNRYNMKFHRVVPGFVIQTGDPTGTGAGGSKQTVPLESKNKLSHNAKGIVAMARGADPNSATSQFYITLAPQTSLDGKYTIFGRVISGLDVLDKIEKDDMLYGIKLVDINSITRDSASEKKNFFSSMF